MECILYLINKKLNSTKKPSTVLKTLNGELIDGTVLHPVVRFNNSEYRLKANYVYLGKFERYYYVHDVEIKRGFIYVNLDVDPLASWVGTIGDTWAYILRCADSSEKRIADALYPAITEKQTTAHSYRIFTEDEVNHGMYVLSVINGTGGVSQYWLNDNLIKTFLTRVLTDNSWWTPDSSAPEGMQKFLKTLFNPMQYITNLIYLPDIYDSKTTEIPSIGQWTGIISGSVPVVKAGTIVTRTTSVAIAEHPQKAYGDYLNCYPYREIILDFSPFGVMRIDPMNLSYGGKSVEIRTSVDITTGNCIIKAIDPTSGAILGTLSANCAVTVPIVQILTNPHSALLQGGAQAINSIMNLNFAGVAQGIDTMIAGQIPMVSSKSDYSGFLGFQKEFQVIVRNQLITEPQDPTDNGRPYMKRDKIRNHSGYIVCKDGELNINGMYNEEAEQINNYMTGGFFYE